MDRLIKGVNKFQQEVFPRNEPLFKNLHDGQAPETLFITCADSRIVPSLITQTDPGELFICRNAGNMVPTYGETTGGVSATIEYAVCALDVKDIVVCGHTQCGAMKGVLHPEALEGMPTVATWLRQGEVARRVVKENFPDLTEEAALHMVTEENVIAQLAHLRTHPAVAARLASGRIALHGWIYHIRSGQVDAWEPQSGHFVPLAQYRVSNHDSRRRVATHAAD
jgi:carbonic anhydrase